MMVMSALCHEARFAFIQEHAEFASEEMLDV